jgi:hypothetical protein
LIIIVLSVVIWPDRITGHKEKRNRPKGLRLGVLAKHEYDGNLRVSQALEQTIRQELFYENGFQRSYDAPTSLPLLLSFGLL